MGGPIVSASHAAVFTPQSVLDCQADVPDVRNPGDKTRNGGNMGNQRIVAVALAVIAGCADSTSTTTATASSQQAVAVSGAQVPASFLQTARHIETRQAPHTQALGLAAAKKKDPPAIDTLVNFSGQFT